MIYYVSNSPSLFEPTAIKSARMDDVLDFFQDKDIIQLDTETTGLNFLTDRLLLVQLGTGDAQFVINTECDISPLKALLEDPNRLKILHNVKFDYKFLRRRGIVLENVYDTQLVEQILHTGKESIEHSLVSTVERHLGSGMDKSLRNTFIGHTGAITEAQILYAAKDVQYLEAVRASQLQDLKLQQLERVAELENQAVLAFGDIEYNGIAIDPEAWNRNSVKVQEQVLEAEKELDKIVVGEPKFGFTGVYIQGDLFKPLEELRKTSINWNSSSQVLRIFKKIVPTLESVGADVLYPVRKKHKIITSYLDYKKKQKLYNSYGPAFLNLVQPDGRIHPEFRQILNTGRVSCNNPNMQQIPSTNEYRNCFIPGVKDYVFVSGDYSSQELCVIAYGSGDPVWLEALSNGQDLHSICADLLFGQKWKDAALPDCNYIQSKSKCKCPEHKKLRDLAKTINFGLAYGMSAYKFSDRADIPLREAEQIITKYFTVFPKIRYFLHSLGNFGKRNGFIKTYPPFSRKRWFEEWTPDANPSKMGEIERASMNTPIQGSSADMTKLALVYVRNYIRKYQVPVLLVMTVHDQIDTIAHKDYAQEWKSTLESIMEKAAMRVIKNGLLKAETSVSEVWKK